LSPRSGKVILDRRRTGSSYVANRAMIIPTEPIGSIPVGGLEQLGQVVEVPSSNQSILRGLICWEFARLHLKSDAHGPLAIQALKIALPGNWLWRPRIRLETPGGYTAVLNPEENYW
jgi:hypothetical protein